MNKGSSDLRPGDSQKKPKPLDTFIQMKKDSRWKVFGQSAFITLTSIFIFGGIGWLIDSRIEGEGHGFFIAMLIISYPVTQFALYKKMKNFNHKNK